MTSQQKSLSFRPLSASEVAATSGTTIEVLSKISFHILSGGVICERTERDTQAVILTFQFFAALMGKADV
jgi:hypothetical protein